MGVGGKVTYVVRGTNPGLIYLSFPPRPRRLAAPPARGAARPARPTPDVHPQRTPRRAGRGHRLVSLTLTGTDYLELLPVQWRAINAYGVRVDHGTYSSSDPGPGGGSTLD